jgi:hypothetical protein
MFATVVFDLYLHRIDSFEEHIDHFDIEIDQGMTPSWARLEHCRYILDCSLD